jgi:glycosyltransferase involved in cell wall biosynthesis
VTMPKVASWTHVDARDFPIRSHGMLPRLLRLARPREFPVENDFATDDISQRLLTVVRNVNPQLIVVSHWHNALPRVLRGRHRLIADTHNVESLLATHLACANKSRLTLRQRFQLYQWRRRELNYLKQTDRIWVTSAEDAHIFRQMDNRLPPIVVWPNAIDLEAFDQFTSRDDNPGYASSHPTIGFVGYYGYGPNAAAAKALIQDIHPRVASALRGSRLLLIGKGPTEFMKRSALQDPNIIVTGEVDDVREYLRDIDVLAVPLTTGGGTRIKILEAFASRIAVVSTAKGAEGIEAVAGRDIEICSVEEMGDRCLELLLDGFRRQRQARAAFALVKERYSWRSLESQLLGALGLL